MKLKLLFTIGFIFTLSSVFSQVGIATTSPNAQLDVRSSNQASPANNDGILIPKIDTFPATNPTAAQQGMLVYLNATTTFLATSRTPGFYYWDNASSNWIGISSTINSDADWFKVGTSTAPLSINDDMYHLGNIAIGKNTTSFPIDIQSTNYDRGINSLFTNNTSNSTPNISTNNSVNGTSTDDTYGTRNSLSGTGATGVQFGTANSISNSGNSNHHGTFNDLSGSGSGNHYGVYTDISGSGTGKQYGSSINISNTSNAIHYGTNNNLSGSGTGFHYGVYTDLSGTGSGEQYGSYISITNTGNAIHYGSYTDLQGVGNGNQFGNSVNINNTGTGIHYGSFNLLTGNGTGLQYGTYNRIINSANANHFGSYNILEGTGTGIKYGNYNYINPSAGGTHYGVYSEVLKSGTNYAGYFLGNVSIGTTTLNNYIFPASRGTNGQIMQTDGFGNVTWQNVTANAWGLLGNGGTSAATNFLGTTDNVDFVIKRNNIRAGYIGDPTYNLSTFDSNNGNTSFGGNSLVNPTVNVASQTGVRNSAFGVNVMPGLTTGQRNTGIGDFALFSATSGNENTALGAGALYSNSTASSNVAIGRNALTTNNASNNTAVGFAALRQNATGTNNTAIGFEALRNVTGSGNVGVGYQAGRLETGSNRLYIENSNADANNALIYGEFDNNIVRVNGTLQISNPASAPGYALPNVRGTAGQVLQTDGAGATNWVSASSLTITETDPQVSSSTTNSVPKWNGTTLVDGIISDDGTNVGIGTAPSVGNKLDVNGNTKTTNFQMTAGANNGYILQSDASGNASWVPNPINTLSLIRTNLTANQVINTTGWQKVNFNTTVFDTNSEFNTSTSRFTATKVGYYEINAGIHTFNKSDAEYYGISVYKNGTEYQETSAHHYGDKLISRTINCLIYLNIGDYIEIYFHNGNAPTTIDAFTGKTYFEVRQVK